MINFLLISFCSLLVRKVEAVPPRCDVTVSGPNPKAKCVFPFTMGSSTFYDCTSHNDPDGKLWCSTKVDLQGVHISGQGNWGFCDPDCADVIEIAKTIFNDVEPDEAADNNDRSCNCLDYKECDWAYEGILDFLRKPKFGTIIEIRDTVCDSQLWKVCCPDFVQSPRQLGRVTFESEENENNAVITSATLRATSPRPITTTTTTTTTTTVATTTKTTSTPPKKDKERPKMEDLTSEDGRWLPKAEKFECGLSFPTGYIVNGVRTKLGEFPHAALIGYNVTIHNRTEYLCGGSLINRRYVVTAAHCHKPEVRFGAISEVILGEWEVGRDPDCESCLPAQRFAISPEDVTVHPAWNIKNITTAGNDIALVRLPRLAITANEDGRQRVIPACLTWRNPKQRIPRRFEFIVTGWGKINNEGKLNEDYVNEGVLEKIMQKLKVPLVPLKECRMFPKYSRLVENQLCAGGEVGKDSCNGDSGGPLITRKNKETAMYLVGIVSFGTKECGKGVPGVYTRIQYYINWIMDNLKP